MKSSHGVLILTLLFLPWAGSLGQTQGPPPVAKPAAKPPAQNPASSPSEAKEAKPAPKEFKPSDVVMWVGEEAVTLERFDALTRSLPPQYEGAIGAMGKKAFADQYGMLRGLAMQAEKEKMDQSPTFKEQMAFARMELLARLAFGEISRFTQVVPDGEIEKYYKEHEGEYQQAKVRGIFVSLTPPSKPDEKKEEGKKGEPKKRTDAEAKELALKLREKILAGADFAAVAKENSDDPATGAKGGDFGTVRKGQLPPNMEKVVFSLKPKEVSEPVPEARGYFLFTVDETRKTTLEEAKPLIHGQLSQKRFTDALEKVKKDYPVKLNEEFFAQQAPPTPAPGAAPAPARPAPPKP